MLTPKAAGDSIEMIVERFLCSNTAQLPYRIAEQRAVSGFQSITCAMTGETR